MYLPSARILVTTHLLNRVSTVSNKLKALSLELEGEGLIWRESTANFWSPTSLDLCLMIDAGNQTLHELSWSVFTSAAVLGLKI